MSNQEQEQVLRHEIITSVADLPKFSGEPNTIDINQFLQRIDTYITNKGIEDHKGQIEALKQNIDASQGRARVIIQYGQMNKIIHYPEYVAAFKKHFTKFSDYDPLRALIKVLTMQRSPTEHFTEFIGRVNTWTRDTVDIVEQSDWTVG